MTSSNNFVSANMYICGTQRAANLSIDFKRSILSIVIHNGDYTFKEDNWGKTPTLSHKNILEAVVIYLNKNTDETFYQKGVAVYASKDINIGNDKFVMLLHVVE